MRVDGTYIDGYMRYTHVTKGPFAHCLRLRSRGVYPEISRPPSKSTDPNLSPADSTHNIVVIQNPLSSAKPGPGDTWVLSSVKSRSARAACASHTAAIASAASLGRQSGARPSVHGAFDCPVACRSAAFCCTYGEMWVFLAVDADGSLPWRC